MKIKFLPLYCLSILITLLHFTNVAWADAHYSSGWSGYQYGKDVNLPDIYDIRTILPLRTMDRQQTHTGWAYAAIAAVEANLKMSVSQDQGKVVPNLSPMTLVYDSFINANDNIDHKYNRFTVVSQDSEALGVVSPIYASTPLSYHGRLSHAVTKLASFSGPYLEKDYSYPNKTKALEPYAWVQNILSFAPNAPHLSTASNNSVLTFANKVEDKTIKNFIYKHGAVAVEINSSLIKRSQNGNFYGISRDAKLNDHSVILVGWNDKFSKDNFPENIRPKEDGVWIAMDSEGNDTSLYIPYSDPSMRYGIAFIAHPAVKGLLHYGHDELGYTNTAYYGAEGIGTAANIFYLRGFHEHIGAIGFYTTGPDVAYQVEVIQLHQGEANGPRDGEILASGNGVIDIPGYHVIHLETPVPVEQDRHLAVIMRMHSRNPKNTIDFYPIALERPMPYYADNAKSFAQESFFSADGITWQDGSAHANEKKNPHQENACIKLFTVPPNPNIASHWTITEENNLTTLSMPLLLNASDTVNATLSAFDDVAYEPVLSLTDDILEDGRKTGFRLLSITAKELDKNQSALVSLRVNGKEILESSLLVSHMRESPKRTSKETTKTGLNGCDSLTLGLGALLLYAPYMAFCRKRDAPNA